MIDNFEKIKPYISDPCPGKFWYVKIVRRKKENPDVTSRQHFIKHWFIRNWEHLESIKDDIRTMCIAFNARAYIYLTPRSEFKHAHILLKKIAERLSTQSYNMGGIIQSSAGDKDCIFDKESKTWMIDIDTKDMAVVNYTSSLVSSKAIGGKVKTIIPTINGYHLITTPFNTWLYDDVYGETYTKYDISKNNPTLLYYESI